MDMELVLFVVVSFLAMKIQGKAGIQYRISEESFNKVAKVLTSEPNGYFVYSGETRKSGSDGVYAYNLTNFRIKEALIKDVTVKIPRDDHLQAIATLSKMELSVDVLLQREQSTDPIYKGSTEVILNNVNFSSDGQVEYTAVSGATIMSMASCNVTAESVNPGDDFVQATATVPAAVVFKMFTDVVCNVYKLQFSLGFTKTRFGFDLRLFKWTVDFYPAHLTIRNKTLLLMYSFDFRFSDDTFPAETQTGLFSLPQFPPVQSTASPFEIWLNEDAFNEFANEFLDQLKIGAGRKVHLTDILPIFDYEELRGYLKYLEQIPKSFPNSTIDVYVTEGDLSIEIRPNRVLLHINATVELVVTLNCNKSKTYTAVKFLLNVFIPVQFGFNQEKITFKYVKFGGNITVLETKIGRIADRFFSHLFLVLPQILPDDVFDDINKKIKGPKISQFIPQGTFIRNANFTIEQGYVVLHGDLTDEVPTNMELNKTDITWVPEYSKDYLGDLWFPLIDDTPEDQKPIPVQDCRRVTSSGRRLTSQTFCLVVLLMFVVVFLWLK